MKSENKTPEEIKIPQWYTKNEMHDYLKRCGYHETIAFELADRYAINLQAAFKKGWEKSDRQETLKLKEENNTLKSQLKVLINKDIANSIAAKLVTEENKELLEALKEVRKHMTAHIPEKVFDMIDFLIQKHIK